MKLRHVIQSPLFAKISVLTATLIGGQGAWADGLPNLLLPTLSFSVPRSQGRIHLNARGDLRKGHDFKLFNSNGHEDGLLGDADLQQIAAYTNRLRALAPKGETGVDYQRRAMAGFMLGRVLEHEATKRRVPSKVTDVRVNYVMRTILIQNAITEGMLRPRPESEAISLYGMQRDPQTGKVPKVYGSAVGMANPELYEWLKVSIAERMRTLPPGQPKQVVFTINWKFAKAGMEVDRQQLASSRGELSWPKVEIVLPALPASVDEFREALRAELQPHQNRLIRNAIWRQLVQERTSMSLQSFSAVRMDQAQKLYDAIKAPGFEMEDMRAEVRELRVSGEKAEAFKTRFMAVLNERQETLTREVIELDAANGEAPTPEGDARLRARVIELRQQVPAEVLRQVQAEMAADLQAGSLKLSSGVRTLEHRGADLLDPSKSLDDAEKAIVMDQAFAIMSLFPHMDAPIPGREAEGAQLIVLLHTVGPAGTTSFMSLTDPRVWPILKAKARARVMGRVFRQLVWELFSENPVEVFREACYPANRCALAGLDPRTAPREWAESLFPETSFSSFLKKVPDVKTPGGESSLGREDRFDQVFSIALEPFTAALEM